LTNKGKQAEVVRIPPPILPRPSKETLEKSKFFQKIKTFKITPISRESIYILRPQLLRLGKF